METIWERKINCLKGIGQRRAELYHRLGIQTVGDLLRFFPRSYLDFSDPVSISQAKLNENNVIRAAVFQKKESSVFARACLSLRCLSLTGPRI